MTMTHYKQNRWWGYMNIRGKVFVRPYFEFDNECGSDMLDAERSPYIKRITKPFAAADESTAYFIANFKLRIGVE